MGAVNYTDRKKMKIKFLFLFSFKFCSRHPLNRMARFKRDISTSDRLDMAIVLAIKSGNNIQKIN